MDLFETQPELTRHEKLLKAKKVTADLTRWAIDYLNNSGVFKVHRSNNFPGQRLVKKEAIVNAFDKNGNPIEIKYDKIEIHFKSNNIKNTILDISGFRSDGVHTELEVKTAKDKLSDEQIKRIKDIKNAGAISFSFSDRDTFLMQIKKYMIDKPDAF